MKGLVVLGVVVVVGLVLAVWSRGGRTTSEDAKALVEGGAVLLDVRTRQEFAQAHLPGALNIPVQNLESRISELSDKARPIVVYCQSGVRSARAQRILTRAGYAAVHDLGPMSAW